MTQNNDVKQLIASHQRRLHKLKELQALAGASVDPRILIEIEDIETKIEELQAALDIADNTQTISLRPPSPVKSIDQPDQLTPFVVGPPIMHPRYFFGRERELKRLFNLWKRRPLQNAAIIGNRRSGKTSLLFYLKHITTTPIEQLRVGQRTDWLSEPERYNWIYVDFQDPRLGNPEMLLRYLLSCMGLSAPTPCSLGRFLDVTSYNIHVPTVIILDEIGLALQRYPELDDTFWEGLRALATYQVSGNLAFVLAAHEAPDQLAHQSGFGSPFFNIFGYTTRLGPLKEAEACELIASSPIPFSTDDTEWILTQSEGWPILLQTLCRERLITLEEGEVDEAWREDGLEQMQPFQHLLD
ncbi:MAG: ATP-binding protein [Anaerolineae bacterium]|nr:ATP-binding protein [Anaerolineae bacterium]